MNIVLYLVHFYSSQKRSSKIIYYVCTNIWEIFLNQTFSNLIFQAHPKRPMGWVGSQWLCPRPELARLLVHGEPSRHAERDHQEEEDQGHQEVEERGWRRRWGLSPLLKPSITSSTLRATSTTVYIFTLPAKSASLIMRGEPGFFFICRQYFLDSYIFFSLLMFLLISRHWQNTSSSTSCSPSWVRRAGRSWSQRRTRIWIQTTTDRYRGKMINLSRVIV